MKNKKNKKVDVVNDDEPIISDNIEDVENENIEFQSFLNEFSTSDYRVDIRKLSKDGSIWERVKTVSLDQFNPDVISEIYGGGKYKFRIIDSTGKFVKQFTCSYAEPVKKPDNVEKQDKNDLTLQILLGQLNNTNQMILEMIKNYRPQQSENFKITDIVNILNSIKNITGDKSEILELIRTGMELGRETSSNESELSKFLEVLGTIYSQRVKNLQPLNKPMKVNTLQIKNNGNNGNNEVLSKDDKEVITPADEVETKVFMITGIYKDLIRKIYASNLPPDLIGTYLYNYLDDDTLTMLMNYLSNDDNINRLSKYLDVSGDFIKNIYDFLKKYIDESNS